jgi:hypothetical protein
MDHRIDPLLLPGFCTTRREPGQGILGVHRFPSLLCMQTGDDPCAITAPRESSEIEVSG